MNEPRGATYSEKMCGFQLPCLAERGDADTAIHSCITYIHTYKHTNRFWKATKEVCHTYTRYDMILYQVCIIFRSKYI